MVGLTGVGGGSLMTPILVLLFGIHPVTAVGTDLLYAAVTKSAGTVVHGMKRTVDWPVVGRLACGSLPASLLALWILSGVDRSGLGATRLLSLLIGGALLVTASALVLKERVLELAGRLRAGRPADPRAVGGLTVAFGALVGLLVTVSSVGAGAIGVMVLLLLYPQLPTSRIVGSDIAHAVPLTLAAGLGHVAIGEVDWTMLAALLVGSIPGIVLGSLVAPRLPERLLRNALACVLIVVGARMLAA